MSNTALTIGRLAKSAQVNVETVRYYQRVGLIRKPPKPPAGYRLYPGETVDRICFIKRAQRLGFTLNEIMELLAPGESRCAGVRARAENKRCQVEARIRELQALRDTLQKLIDACDEGNDAALCPIVETLSGQEST